MRSHRSLVLLCLALMPVAGAWCADNPAIEATTLAGDKVRLLANGRWEYLDSAKQAQAKTIADQFPENHTLPAGAQGGMFGVGRVILPGDKEYNRGSLNPKLR